MKNYQQKSKSNYVKNSAMALGALSIFGASIIAHNNKNYLGQEDFENAEWIKSHNPSGTIWHPYMNEDIPKNQPNWHLYIDEVRKRNNNNLEGIIFLPDLDGDGKVGRKEK